MTHFTPLHDKTQTHVSRDEAFRRESSEEEQSPESSHGDSDHSAALTISESPAQATTLYQDQIRAHLRRMRENKTDLPVSPSTESQGIVGALPPLGADDSEDTSAEHQEVRIEMPCIEEEKLSSGASSMQTSALTAPPLARRGINGQSFPGKLLDDNQSFKRELNLARQTKGAWKKMQLARSKMTKPASPLCQAAVSLHVSRRVRGTQLEKPLRELVRQREIVKEKDDDGHLRSMKTAWSPLPAWRPPGEGEKDLNFAHVQSIVGKARTYQGPKTDRLNSQAFGRLQSLTMAFPYMKAIFLVLLGIIDLILAVRFHILWTPGDFLCNYDSGPGPGRPRIVPLALLASVAGLHCLRTVAKLLKSDGGGEMVGLRFFYSKELFGYFGLWVNNADVLLNAASVGLLVIHFSDCPEQVEFNHEIARKIHGHVHLLRSLFAFQRCFSMKEYLRQQLQIAVSVNKRRFINPCTNLNLDLTYICDRLIAMAIPCVDYSMYRNDIRDVARFFAVFHYGTFLVYNLCEGFEESGNGNYDTSFLYNQVQKVSFRDHNVPRFRCIVKFCETASQWLNAGDKNVVAVHCQGGKGRTGTFCAAIMLWSGLCATAQEALDKFALRRTQRMRYGETLQGVSSPSQIRYVHYLEAYVYEGVDYHECNHRLMTQVSLHNMKQAAMRNACLVFVVEVDGVMHYDYGNDQGCVSWEDCEKMDFTFDIGTVVVAGDVTIRFYLLDEAEGMDEGQQKRMEARGVLGDGARSIKYGSIVGKQAFFVSFHTAFHGKEIELKKNEVDGAYSAPEEKFDEDFSMKIQLQDFLDYEAESSPVLQPAQADGSFVHLKGLEHLMPRKINPALQLLRTRMLVRDTFERLCPIPVEHVEGDCVVPNATRGQVTLYYIAKGTTSTQRPSIVFSMKTVKNVFDGEVHAVGDILQRGLDLSLNNGQSTQYYASALGTQTRIISFPLSPDGYLPVQAPELSQQELAGLYSYLSHQVSSRSRKYRDKISAMFHQTATLRSSRALETRTKTTVLRELRARFGIASTEVLMCSSPAEYQRVETGKTACGHAHIVSNWVLFCKARSIWDSLERHEVVVRIRDILAVERHADALHIQIGGSGESVETRKMSTTESEVAVSDAMSTVSSLPTSRMKRAVAKTLRRPIVPMLGNAELMQRREVGREVTLSFEDEEVCETFTRELNERIRELNLSEGNQHQMDMRNLKFGYILPAECDDEGGRAFLQHLLNISEVRVYAPGEEIIARDDSSRTLYHVISGTALRYSGSCNHMEDIGPGEIVGEWRFLAYNSGFAETSQVVASTEVKCFASPFEQVQTLCSLREEFAVRFYRGLALSCIMRARQFRRLYQQNLQQTRDGEENRDSTLETGKRSHVRSLRGNHRDHNGGGGALRKRHASPPRSPLSPSARLSWPLASGSDHGQEGM